MTDFDFTFSAGEHCQVIVDENWLVWKDIGNRSFKERRYREAAAIYSDALFIARGFDVVIPFFIQLLRSKDPSSTLFKVVQLPHVRDMLKLFLNKPWTIDHGARIPNLPAAICLSNRAICYLNLYKQLKADGSDSSSLQELLIFASRDGDFARRVCPTHLKGHHRYMEAQKLLGRLAEYEDVKNQLDVHAQLTKFPETTEGLAALMLEWIDTKDLEFVYMPLRRKEAYRQIKSSAKAGTTPCLSLEVSLVPVSRGQGFTASIHFITCDWKKVVYRQMEITLLDPKNGDDLELPPNGRPSKLALKNAMKKLNSFIGELKREGFSVFGLTLGQGLVGREKLVRASLSKEFDEQTLSRLHITNSVSTYASQKAMGFGIPEF